MIVYLSGGMEHTSNNVANWRIKFGDRLKNDLGHEVIDPVQESRKLVQEKKQLITMLGKSLIHKGTRNSSAAV